MILSIDSGRTGDLTTVQIRILDQRLRNRIPQLKGWCYSPRTGELILDFGDTEDNNLMNRINNWNIQAEGVRLIWFELLEMIRKW